MSSCHHVIMSSCHHVITLILAGSSSGSECDPDNYVQFGRDILFITTHLSPRLCHNNTGVRRRHYTEIQVRNSSFRSARTSRMTQNDKMNTGWPKMKEGWPKMTAGWQMTNLEWPKMILGWLKITPVWLKMTPGWPHDDPHRALISLQFQERTNNFNHAPN